MNRDGAEEIEKEKEKEEENPREHVKCPFQVLSCLRFASF